MTTDELKSTILSIDTMQRLIDIYNRDLKKGVITMTDYKTFMSRVDRALLERD